MGLEILQPLVDKTSKAKSESPIEILISNLNWFTVVDRDWKYYHRWWTKLQEK